MVGRIAIAVLRTLFTPTFWGTVLGIWWWAHGLDHHAGLAFMTVGWGGVGQAVMLGVQADRDPWHWASAVEAVWKALARRRWPVIWGLVGHLPQAVVGILLLS